MKSTITVRDIDSRDKSWLRRESRRLGLSMEEFVRRLIRQTREKATSLEKPSEVFQRYFGADHGTELPSRRAYTYQKLRLDDSD